MNVPNAKASSDKLINNFLIRDELYSCTRLKRCLRDTLQVEGCLKDRLPWSVSAQPFKDCLSMTAWLYHEIWALTWKNGSIGFNGVLASIRSESVEPHNHCSLHPVTLKKQARRIGLPFCPILSPPAWVINSWQCRNVMMPGGRRLVMGVSDLWHQARSWKWQNMRWCITECIVLSWPLAIASSLRSTWYCSLCWWLCSLLAWRFYIQCVEGWIG